MDSAGVAARKLVIEMGKVFDLRKLVAPLDAAAESAASAALAKIYAAAVESGTKLAALDLLSEQLVKLRSRILLAATAPPYNARDKAVVLRGGAAAEEDMGGWFTLDGGCKSGTVIMKALFKLDEKTGAVPDLSKGLGQILYLLQHCVLKSKNEACVEGYGSTIERHASKLRGNQEQENYAAEAFLHINGPLLHEADDLIKRALDLFFTDERGRQKPWHFCNTAESLAKNMKVLKSVELSKVLTRLYAETSKASFTASKKRKRLA